MELNRKIQSCIEKLPPSFEEEVVDFLTYLLAKAEWSRMSVAFAMREMESESSDYSVADLKLVY